MNAYISWLWLDKVSTTGCAYDLGWSPSFSSRHETRAPTVCQENHQENEKNEKEIGKLPFLLS